MEKELLKKMSSSTDLMSAMSPVDDLQIAGCLTEDSGVKSLVEDVNHSRKGDEKELWVQILEPVAQIPTNTGARIRNRVQESLKEGPPDWARKVLEWSITKEIFKGNAAGPTKVSLWAQGALCLTCKLREVPCRLNILIAVGPVVYCMFNNVVVSFSDAARSPFSACHGSW